MNAGIAANFEKPMHRAGLDIEATAELLDMSERNVSRHIGARQ